MISTDFKFKLLHTTGVPIKDSASQFTSHLQSTVGLNPTSLDTLLCILVNKAGISGRAVADNIAQICKFIVCKIIVTNIVQMGTVYQIMKKS